LPKSVVRLMGLSFSIASKVIQRRGNERFRATAVSMQGHRATMEDAHLISLQLANHPKHSLFGVFDGHNGSKAARYLTGALEEVINKLDNFEPETISKAMLDLDDRLIKDLGGEPDGSTCTFVIVEQISESEFKVLAINIGDSRSLILHPQGFTVMTVDHKPDMPEELRRIEAAGGSCRNGRVDGNLALARAFGDAEFKQAHHLPREQQKVIAKPDVTVFDVKSSDILFVACDGLFEAWSNEQCVENLRAVLQKTPDDPAAALCALLDLNESSNDNMTAIIIEFIDGTDYDRKEDEFIPGPIPEDASSSWLEAYYDNARQAGYSREQVEELRRLNPASQAQPRRRRMLFALDG